MNWRDLISSIADGIKIKINAEITISADKPKGRFTIECPDCGWTDTYSSTFSAKRGLDNHQKDCTGRVHDHTIDTSDYEWIQDMHNGDEQ